MIIIWCMVLEISSVTDKLFVILDQFLPFYPANNLKNQNFEKIKKPSGEITTWHMCTINDNHMMHGSWDMKRNGQNFLSFWTVFCPFFFTLLEMSSFYTSVPKIMIICYTAPEIWRVTDVIIFHFGPFFALLPLNSPKNQN